MLKVHFIPIDNTGIFIRYLLFFITFYCLEPGLHGGTKPGMYGAVTLVLAVDPSTAASASILTEVLVLQFLV